MFNRVIFSDNGTLVDFSVNLDKFRTGTSTFNYTTSQDALYLGSRFPFNHRWFEVDTVNDQSADITIQYWDGKEFVNTVEVIDETSLSGVPFAQSGFITWTPDEDTSWSRDHTADAGGEQVTGLGDVTIYDLYWIKITYSATLNASTAFKWVGNIFSDDDDLVVEYPDLLKSAVLTSFEAGKTDWKEQHIRAASIVITDMISKGIIDSGDQILERRVFKDIAVSKTAELIFNSFGDDFIDNRNDARIEYNKRLSKDIFLVDRNNDGKISIGEEKIRQGVLSR